MKSLRILCGMLPVITGLCGVPGSNNQGHWVKFSSFRYEGHDPLFEAAPPTQQQFYNPILAGYFPDPSVCRVGEDFYLVHSSFSYYPGVPIFHSRNLVDWKQIGHVLNRPSQLPLDGLPVSSGIFAPSISHHAGKFYLITTNVRGIGNFYVTASDPAGPWSDPIRLPINGIDPSFFWDDDGQAYVIHNGPPPADKPLYEGHRAIWLWRFDESRGTLSDGRILVNGGVNLSQKPVWIEGPHLFRHEGYYYLCAAEGGTSVNHSQVVLRSRSLDEPFMPWEENPILTQRDLPGNRANPVTSVGHAQLVQTTAGEWWAVFLGVRPYEGNHYNTGRETFLLPVTWKQGWPRILAQGSALPRVLARPQLSADAGSGPATTGSFVWTDDFAGQELDQAWSFLRTPRETWWSLKAAPGFLSLCPRPVRLDSVHRVDTLRNGNPSFIARRQQHAQFKVSVRVQVPEEKAKDAGLAVLQNDTAYLLIGLRHASDGSHRVFLEKHEKEDLAPESLAEVELPADASSVILQIEGHDGRYACSYGITSVSTRLGPNVDARFLSTQSSGGFVGCMLGLYARSNTAEETESGTKH